MPKLIENVLIGDRVRLAGEDISDADAKGVRPEVFAPAAAPVAVEAEIPGGVVSEDPAPVEEEVPVEPAEVEAAPAKSTGRKSSSTK